MITYNVEGVRMPAIKKRATNAWIRAVAASHGRRVGEVGYMFVDDEKILEVNNEYLGHNYYTDVITFDYDEDDVINGDIVISLDTVRSNAELFGKTYDDELHRVIIHGILHLCGIDDKGPGERELMEAAENRALALLSDMQRQGRGSQPRSGLLYPSSMKRQFLPILLAAFLAASGVQAQPSAKGPEWLSRAIFYQIYPSSFQDSDGNGIGDLPGIISRLDYIQSLGVNALWLNPVYESGWFDGGYDIIDFYRIDPRFGTNSDMVRLIDEAHKRGLRVCLDLVAGHTSDRCRWFVESATADPNSRYSDYYIWPDSISADEREQIRLRHASAHPASDTRGHYVESPYPRARYYMKNYFECQPALNYGYAHPDPSRPWEQAVTAPGPQAVRRELRNIMAFWLDKGIDGFRVDMASSLVKNDPDRSAIRQLWQEMRQWRDSHYPHCALIAEWSNPAMSIPAGFDVDFFMHFNRPGYPSLFFDRDTPAGSRSPFEYSYFNRNGRGRIDQFIDNFSECYRLTRDRGYIGLPTANHDFQRLRAGSRNTPDQLRVAMTFLLTMPGIPFVYYGDEIGMRYQPDAPDVEGATDRAGSRTPMQWEPGPTAGFSTCAVDSLYLPVSTDGGLLTVRTQEADPRSLLHYVRHLLRLRRDVPALGNEAGWTLLSDKMRPYPMVYRRSTADDVCIVAVNPSAASVSASIPTLSAPVEAIAQSGKVKYKRGATTDRIVMGPVSAVVYRLSCH